MQFPLGLLSFATLAASAAAQAPTVELWQYWSGTNPDFALSSDPSFAAKNPGYTVHRSEGFAISPNDARPADTVEIHTWWSPARRDHHTSADPAWYGSQGSQQQGYTWVRKEGYAYQRDVAGTVELRRFFHGSFADSWSTTEDSRAGYADREILGYLLPSERDPNGGGDSRAFHHATMNPRGLSARPLAVLLWDFSDAPWDSKLPRNEVERRFFGTGYPSVKDYVAENSTGLYQWARAGVFGPIRFADDPLTVGDESAYFDVVEPLTPTLAPPILYFTIETRTGRFWYGDGGGANTVDSVRDGATFSLVDLTLGRLTSGDIVAMKTFGGSYLRRAGDTIDARGTSITAAERFRVRKVGGTGEIDHGDSFTLQSMQNGRYVQAAGGSTLTVNATSPGSDGTFELGRRAIPRNLYALKLLTAAAAAGLDLARYDANGNGIVEAAELDFSMLVGAPSTAMNYRGATHVGFATGTVPGTSVRVSNNFASTRQASSFMSFLHELTHTIGTKDIYPPAGRNSYVSLMGPTVFSDPFDTQSFHLDPWHRFRLGWQHARIIDITDAGGSAALRALGAARGPLDRDAWPIILYDPARYDLGTRSGEFFVLEYRTPTQGSYDADVGRGHPALAPKDGMALWRVATDANGNLQNVPTPGGIRRTDNHLGAPDFSIGSNALWTAANGTITPDWEDESIADLRLRISAHDRDDELLFVEWSRTGTLRPRLDVLDRRSAAPGDVVTVYGEFPVTPVGASVRLLRGLSLFDGSIVHWDAESVSFRVPGSSASSPPPGVYEVSVSVNGSRSNALDLEVSSYSGFTSPVQLETTEANSRSSLPFAPQGGTGRYQQVHGDLRGNPMTISSVQFRRDALIQDAGDARTVELEMWMGHSDYDRFSPSYDQNFEGGRVQVIARKRITLPDLGGMPVSSPAPFLITLRLDTPFAYNGTDDLIWEIVVHDAPSGTYRLDTAVVGHAIEYGANLGGGCPAPGQTNPMGMRHAMRDDGGMLRMEFSIERGPAGGFGVVHLDFFDRNLTIPWLCGTVHALPTISLPMPGTNHAGFSRWGVFQFPNDPAWAALPLFAQALYSDGVAIVLGNGRRFSVPAAHARRGWKVARCYGPSGRPDMVEWGDGLVVKFD